MECSRLRQNLCNVDAIGSGMAASLQRERETMQPQTSFIPEFFEPLLAQQYGEELARLIIAGCVEARATTLRANTLKASRREVADALDDAGISWEAVPWYDDAFVLPAGSERAVRDLALYEEGGVYLQSLSSMIPALVMCAKPGEDVCDMCAAPGGKTTQICALAQGGAYITACEMHAPRAEKLQHNLQKLGARGVTVMVTDARRLDDFFSFDRVLVDAPCSGSGTLNAHDPKIARRFTQALVQKSVKSQRALLGKGLSALKPGASLVYSTCSVLSCENEEAVSWALEHAGKGRTYEVKPIELPGADDLPALPTSLPGTLVIRPTERYEGFFVARIARTK